MSLKIEIVINKILSKVLDIDSLESLQIFKFNGVLEETTYFETDDEKKILISKKFNKEGKLLQVEKYNKEEYYWELDDLIIHKFDYTEPNKIVELLYKKNSYYGNVIREFDEESNLLKESRQNEDYENDYIKSFKYDTSGQILNITIEGIGDYKYREINFTWKQNFPEMIEVISYLQENRFYKEYFFISRNTDSIEVNLERRGSVSKMKFKFKNDVLTVWDYSIKRIGKIPNEERTLMIYDPFEAKRVIIISNYRDSKFISAYKNTLLESLIGDHLEEEIHKTTVINMKTKTDKLDEDQFIKLLKDYA